MTLKFLTFAVAMLCATALLADMPVIEKVAVSTSGDRMRFDVTLSHGDTGWDHYADGWGVYAPDGTELGYRVLAHPHVNEQPFTRSLSIAWPQDITAVTIIPRDSVHGEGAAFQVDLPKR